MYDSSVPIPKFASAFCQADANFGIDRDTSKSMILVWFTDQKFAAEGAAIIMRTSDPPH